MGGGPAGTAPPEAGGQTPVGGTLRAGEAALAETTHFLTFHSKVIRMGI